MLKRGLRDGQGLRHTPKGQQGVAQRAADRWLRIASLLKQYTISDPRGAAPRFRPIAPAR